MFIFNGEKAKHIYVMVFVDNDGDLGAGCEDLLVLMMNIGS